MKRLKDNLIHIWSSLGLKSKLLAINIAVIIVPVMLLDAYFFSATMKTTRENAMEILYSGQQNIVQSIQSKADAMEKMAEILALDVHIQSVFGNRFSNESDRVVEYQLVTGGSVGHTLKFSQDVNAIYIFNEDMVLCEMADSFFSVQQDKTPTLFDALNLHYPDEAQRWSLTREGLHNVVRPEISPSSMLSFQRVLLTSSGRRCGVVEIVCDKNKFLQAMYEQELLKDGYSCIVDDTGTILYSTQGVSHGMVRDIGIDDYTPGQEICRVGNDSLQIVLPIDKLGASLVTSVPLKSLYSRTYFGAVTVIMLSLISLVLCCMLFSLLAQRQLRSIPPMMRAMHQIRKGDFTTRVPIVSQDELGALAKDFNYMSEKLQEQVDKVYIAGQMEREAELRALAANINPHFLYNSLATITWMARAKQSPEIVEITEALARLYRMVLSDGRSILSFADEMEIVTAYLKVQKVRFEDKCNVSVDVTEEALAFPVIKNIVQPLVENALEHGIGPKLGEGCVSVRAFVEEDRLDICVSDDGVGMTEACRLQVVRGEKNKAGSRGYAVRNIQDRLKVFYEGKYEFSLHSAVGEGTTVHMILPRPKKIWKDDEKDA